MANQYPLVRKGLPVNKDQQFDINAFFSPDVVAANNGLVSQLNQNAASNQKAATTGGTGNTNSNQ